METKNFESSKKEILRRAKKADACSGQYSRAYKSENAAELLEVIKDNIYFACNSMGISPDILSFLFSEDDLIKSHLYLNGNHAIELKEGKNHIILLGSSSANVETFGSSSANVKTLGSSSANVKTWGRSSANVKTLDSSSANVKTLDSSSANVETFGSSSANVETWGSSSKLIKEVKSERSFIRSHNDNTIYVLTGSDLRLEEN